MLQRHCQDYLEWKYVKTFWNGHVQFQNTFFNSYTLVHWSFFSTDIKDYLWWHLTLVCYNQRMLFNRALLLSITEIVHSRDVSIILPWGRKICTSSIFNYLKPIYWQITFPIGCFVRNICKPRDVYKPKNVFT